MKNTSPDRKGLFAAVNQFSFAVPPAGVRDFAVCAAAKRKSTVRCQINATGTGDGSALGSEP